MATGSASEGVASTDPTDNEQLRIDPSEHTIWIDGVFPTGNLPRQVAVAALISIVVYVIEYGIAVAGGQTEWFLESSTFLIGGVGIFVLLILIARWTEPYVAMWADLERSFACSPEEYHATIDPWFGRLYDNVTIVALFWAYDIPYNLAFVLPTYRESVGQGLTLIVHNAVIHFLGATLVYLFLTHIVLTYAVSKLSLANVYTAAYDLEPITDHSTVSGVIWFFGVTLFVIHIQINEFGFSNLTLSQIESMKTGVNLVVLLFLILIGILIILVPFLVLHETLVNAKRQRLRTIDAEFERVLDSGASGTGDRDVESLVDRMDSYERLRQNASQIRTWTYKSGMTPRIVATTIIPLLELTRQLLQTTLGAG